VHLAPAHHLRKTQGTDPKTGPTPHRITAHNSGDN
jgi:hypothetical protein